MRALVVTTGPDPVRRAALAALVDEGATISFVDAAEPLSALDDVDAIVLDGIPPGGLDAVTAAVERGACLLAIRASSRDSSGSRPERLLTPR